MISNALIITFEIFSIPFCSPMKQTANPIRQIMTIQSIIVGAFPSISENDCVTASGDAPAKSPRKLFTQ